VEKGHIDKPFEEGEFPESTFQNSCLKSFSDKEKKTHRNIMMLGALANWQPRLRRLIDHAYRVAIKDGYRFYSFGDAMLIL